jgi:hypothetical protein
MRGMAPELVGREKKLQSICMAEFYCGVCASLLYAMQHLLLLIFYMIDLNVFVHLL